MKQKEVKLDDTDFTLYYNPVDMKSFSIYVWTFGKRFDELLKEAIEEIVGQKVKIRKARIGNGHGVIEWELAIIAPTAPTAGESPKRRETNLSKD